MKRAFLSQRNHLFRERTNRLGFGQGGLDSLVLNQAADLVG
jgi:hypothetical protein